jgi:hypothetical protein
LFEREDIDGASTSYRSLYELRAGQLVYSRLFAWEGAITVVPQEFDGYFVSHEFPTFAVDDSVIDIDYLACLTRWPALHEELAGKTTGLGVRRQRVNPDRLLEIEVPLPPRDDQRRIAASVGGIHSKSMVMNELTARHSPKFLLSTLPGLTQQIFSDTKADRQPVAGLAEFVADTVHPGDDPGDAALFVGLQHIESHSGRRLGSMPVGDEKGRRFRFRPEDVVYGYLRPYLNKAWVADRHGLCSVDQYVLRPRGDVRPELLAHGLRTRSTLDEAIRLTHSLQPPRLRSGLLASIEIPTVTTEQLSIESRLRNVVSQVCELADLRGRQLKLVSALETAALNEAFADIA